MTARPPAVPRVSCAAFTQDEIRGVLVKREHDRLHDEWKRHERTCDRCVFGYPCRIADAYATAADDAGKRWTLAEEAAVAARQSRAVTA